MKRTFYAMLMLFAALSSASAAVDGIEIKKTDGEVLHIDSREIRTMTFVDDNAVLTSNTDVQLLVPQQEIVSIAHLTDIATA